MATIVRSVLNQNALGPGLTLNQGGLVVTTTTDALSNARKVLATQPRAIGSTGFECQFWSTSRPALLPAGNRVGLATPDCSLTTCVGNDASSIGYDINTGDIFVNSVSVANIGPCVERKVITVYARILRSGILRFCVGINGAPQIDYNTGLSGYTWLPAATVCGSNAADINAFFNFGQTAMNYPLISGPA